MPAIVFLFAGMARSYASKILAIHGLARDHQRAIRRQPCGDLRVHRVIADLRGHSCAAFRPYPHQGVSCE